MVTVFIYELVDPITMTTRYIGKTNNMQVRFSKHLYSAKSNKTHVASWIRGLLIKNKTPIMHIVDVVLEQEWEFWEKHYISLYRSWGFDLVNLTDGGSKNRCLNVVCRKAISKRISGKKLSDSHVANIKLALDRRSSEQKQSGIKALIDKYGFDGYKKICRNGSKSRKLKGYTHSSETKLKISKGNLGLKKGIPSKKRKQILQLDQSGKVVLVHDSYMDAAKSVETSAGYMHTVVNKGLKFKNFNWRVNG